VNDQDNERRKNSEKETGMSEITLKECMAGAWRDAGHLIRQRPLLIVVSVAILFFIHVVEESVQVHVLAYPMLTLSALCGLGLIRFLCMSAITVQGLRYVLVGNNAVGARTFVGRDFWRYCGVTYGLAISMAAIALSIIIAVIETLHAFGIYAHFNALFATMGGIALVIALWVYLRISLLPSHVAIGKPVGWRAAWRDTRGHALSIFGTWLAIIAPLIGLAILVSVAIALIAITAHDHNLVPLMALTHAVLLVPALAVFSAGSAWIYRRYAAQLLAQSPAA
jgi:hypothetical protein